MPYRPGLHILAEFTVTDVSSLSASAPCKVFFDRLITGHGLEKVGEVYHDFEGAGFTAVLCLTESHLSIHTWPEYGLATFDVFLSNYQKYNTQKVHDIYSQVLAFFNATEIKRTELTR